MIFTSTRPIETNHVVEVVGGLSHVIGDPSWLRFEWGSTVTIHSWGSGPFFSMKGMFRHCDVTILCDESPVFAPGCSLEEMFEWCVNFDQNLRWDTSNITNMSLMFFGCRRFNQNLRWNTSNVTDMCGMFSHCTSFDQNLLWDTSNVTDMGRMFYFCGSFNQNLRWDTSDANTEQMF